MTRDESMHVRDWLLQADLAELRNPPAHIASHVDACLRCQAERAAVLRGYATLDAGLDKLVRRKHRRWVWPALPLAAAAVLALLLTRGSEQTPPPPSPLLAQLLMPAPSVVTPPAGKQAVVIEKNNLTVVWLY